MKNFLTTLTIIYFAPGIAMLLFGGVVYLLHLQGRLEVTEIDPNLLRYIMYALTPAGVVAGHFVFKKQLSDLDQELPFRQKMSKFQAAMLIRSALIEVPGLLGAVFAKITDDMTFLFFIGITAVLFVYWRPTRESIAEDLQLSEKERMVLSDPDGILPP